LSWSHGSMGSLRRPISNLTEMEKGIEVAQPTDSVAADTLLFNFPSTPQPQDYFPPRRTKSRVFPLKNSCRMDIFSSPPPPPRSVPPVQDENQFSLDNSAFPLTPAQSENLKISITTNRNLSIPSPVLFSPPPPLLSFNFDVNNTVSDFGIVTTRQDFNEDSNKLNSPLYCNPIDVSNFLGIEDEEGFESDPSDLGNIGSPDSTTSETDAYLETCQSLQPIAQLS